MFDRPAWQNTVKRIVGARRGVPDISMSAAISAGAARFVPALAKAVWRK